MTARLVEQGWTAPVFRSVIEAAAAWTVAHQSGMIEYGPQDEESVQRRFGSLVMHSFAGLPAPVMIGWLEVLASLPQGHECAILIDDLRDGSGQVEEWAPLVHLGHLGPLASRAGLTPTDAATQFTAGALDDEGLRTLIALQRPEQVPVFTPAA